MEDWMYGGSWAPGAMACAPGGAPYAAPYGPATHRAAVLLVEASTVKTPPQVEAVAHRVPLAAAPPPPPWY